MTKFRNIIIMVVVLALLGGSYIFLKNRPDREEPQAQKDKVTILKFDKNEITQMVLKSSKGVLTFNKVEKEIEEEKDGKKEKVKKSMWEVDYPHPVVLKQMSVDDIAYSFASLYAERVVEEETPEDLTPYGLKEPQVVAEATLEDGSKKVLLLGNKTAAGNTYYLMVEGQPEVFEVWMNHGEHFNYTLVDVRDKTLASINLPEMTYFKIGKKDSTSLEIKINENQSEDEAQFGLGMWTMTSPYSEPRGVDGEAFQKVLEPIASLSIEDFIDDDPQDLGKYGLDQPLSELVIQDDTNKLHLYFGKDADDGKVYFKIGDAKTVYSMSKNKLEFMNTKPFQLIEKFAYIVYIDNVDKIVVEGKGKNHTLTLDRKTKKAEKEGEEDEEITTYRVDGKEVDEKPFKKYYQSLIGILADAENDKELSGTPEVKTTFFLNKGKEREVHVNYIPYDKDFFAIFKNEKAEFVTHRSQVNGMLEDLEALIRGDLVKED